MYPFTWRTSLTTPSRPRWRKRLPDIIVANNWRTWLPAEVFDAPKYGTLNIHDSLLPKYTGFSPLIWALINGEEEVGLTAHLMDEELDAGDIVLQRSTTVGPTDTVTDTVSTARST